MDNLRAEVTKLAEHLTGLGQDVTRFRTEVLPDLLSCKMPSNSDSRWQSSVLNSTKAWPNSITGLHQDMTMFRAEVRADVAILRRHQTR